MVLDLTADAPTFLADFADEVIYRTTTGYEHAIAAIVDLLDPAELPEAERALGPAWQVIVANDATIGIDAADLKTGTDVLVLPARVGRTAVTARIMAIVSQDKGMLTLRVR